MEMESSSRKVDVNVWQSKRHARMDGHAPQQARLQITVEEETTYVVDGVVLPAETDGERHIVRTVDLSLFLDDTASFLELSHFLDLLSLPRAFHRQVVDKMVKVGRRAAAQWTNVGRGRRGPVIFTIVTLKDRRLIDDVAAGMVPAEAGAVERLLKRARVVGPGDVRKGKGSRESETTTCERSCSICFEEEIPAGSTVAMMPCSHVFHEECIVRWLKESHYCPLCRFAMPTGTTAAASSSL